jgi:iron-sulfur cluster assembly accessory protein
MVSFIQLEITFFLFKFYICYLEKLNRVDNLLYYIMESAQQTKVVDVTLKAAEKVIEFMKQEGKDNLYLRVYVTGGGCSGLSYGMGFEENPDEDDMVLEQNGVKILVDNYSQKYLKGANVDYIESLMGSGFKISNPNVTKSCSCGHSFSTE